MNAIMIISAGAGSGKTRRLAELLEEEIRLGRVRPHAVLATTFTNKAAAELHERVRTKLLQAGQTDAAQRLGAARIGTVNSVCGRIVTECAFELGLSPQLDVLDQTTSRTAIAESISASITAPQLADLAELGERLGDSNDPWDWRKAVASVIDAARANDIAPARLADSQVRSIESFLELLEVQREDEATLDSSLVAALRAFVVGVAVGGDTTAKTEKCRALAELALSTMDADERLRWADWVRLATSGMETGVRSTHLATPVRTAALAYQRHPRLHSDLRRAISLVYGVAADALSAYAEHKRARGVIDFTDQEVLARVALRNPAVRERLADDLDLILVDEFQDTSPLQLAVFLDLSKIAKRSVWVGDQKQAIYGFRGTDPALMDAAIAEILGGNEPETLPRSWRSRPELVLLTSDLFVQPFVRQGIPATRVRLEPNSPDEPNGLGPAVERWTLTSSNQDDDAAALAASLAQFMADETVRVRDDVDGMRPARLSDVAILCQTNDVCVGVASALADIGIPAVISRGGLLATPEALALLAGLALWCDGRDALAAATIARLVHFAPDGDDWLAAILARPGIDGFADCLPVRRVIALRGVMAQAGALAAFDGVLGALDLREACLRWGESPARLANLDALRAHAQRYVNSTAAAGTGCTPAGLHAFLLQIGEAGEDLQAPLPGDAVVVSTWHGAKGLEWPITVLFQLGKRRNASALGVRVTTDEPRIDLAEPLRGRWIRYWPQPFQSAQTQHPWYAALTAHPASVAARQQQASEDLRLLYVGWTRAKDRIVLAERDGRLTREILGLLTADDGTPLIDEPSNETTWAGRRVDVLRRAAAPRQPSPRSPKAGEGYVTPGPKEYPPATLRPSEFAPSDVVATIETIGSRMPLNGSPDMADLGSAVHGFLATDRLEFSEADRLALADGLLQRWGVHTVLAPIDLLRTSDWFRAWVDRHMMGAKWYREWPIEARLDSRSRLRGRVDLLLETAEGFVVVDHKTYPGRLDEAVERSRGHAGQLLAYAAAVEAATNRRVLGTYVHLATLGAVVRLGAREA